MPYTANAFFRLSASIVEMIPGRGLDRKSTRLNSSHDQISYAVFCLKKKKTQKHEDPQPQLRYPAPSTAGTATRCPNPTRHRASGVCATPQYAPRSSSLKTPPWHVRLI